MEATTQKQLEAEVASAIARVSEGANVVPLKHLVQSIIDKYPDLTNERVRRAIEQALESQSPEEAAKHAEELERYILTRDK